MQEIFTNNFGASTASDFGATSPKIITASSEQTEKANPPPAPYIEIILLENFAEILKKRMLTIMLQKRTVPKKSALFFASSFDALPNIVPESLSLLKSSREILKNAVSEPEKKDDINSRQESRIISKRF
jgi:hypothetical protein